MTIPDAPWIGLCKEDWENRISKSELVGYCYYCDTPIYENDNYDNIDGILVCNECRLEDMLGGENA